MKNMFMTLLFLTFSVGGIFANELVLVDQGSSPYKIVLSDTAMVVDKTAATELQTHVKMMTGVEWPIVTEKAVPGNEEQIILIGSTERTKKYLQKEKIDPKFAFDTILLRVSGKTIYLTGHEQRGSLYAVYTFLEDIAGCRWWTPTASYIPKQERFAIPSDLSIQYTPQMISREMYHRLAQPGVFSARNKGNGGIDAKYGGRINIHNGVHSFYKYIPPEKYFKDHPEWFSEIKGKRTCETAQLCLTNEDMRKELTKNLLVQMRNTPGVKIVDISQNDCFNFCTCPKCKAIDDAEGSHAGTLIDFLNRVADDVRKEFPDVLIESLAYQYTRKPPKNIRPRDNILIRLCSIECSFSVPLEDKANEEFASDIAGWKAITKQLFVWDYTTDYHDYVGPFPNWSVMVPNLRFFVKNGAIGLFEESEGDDFAEVRNWVLMHLMWNPQLDEKKLFKEFCDGYYGPEVTPFFVKYLTLMTECAKSSGKHIGCFAPEQRSWLDLVTLNQATDIFNQAKDTVLSKYGKDSVQLKRLTKTAMSIDRTWLRFYRYYKMESLRLKAPFQGPKDPIAAAETFQKNCKRFGITSLHISDKGDEIQKLVDTMKLEFLLPKDLPDFCRNIESSRIFMFDDLAFANFLNAAKRVADPAAWDKKATSMSTKVDWNVSYNPFITGNFHAWVSLRCDASHDEGDAMTWGIYDWGAKKGLFSKTIPVRELRGKDYRWIDFGVVPFTYDAGFWFAHRHNKDVSNVFVDRVILIAEPEK